jgi:hypothetical protein
MVILAMAVLLSLMSTAVASAQGGAGGTIGEWMPMDNEPHWYSFVVGHEDEEPLSYVTVSLASLPAGGSSFKLFRPEEANYWGEPEMDSWFGASAETDNGDHQWSGYLVPGAYYVRVEPRGVHECCFSVSGLAVQEVQAIDLSPYTPPAPAPVMAQTTVSAPSTALTAPAEPQEMAMEPGQWMPILDRDPHWFPFYVQQLDGDTPVPVTIYTAAKPEGGLPFEVYAGAGIDPYATPEEGDWMGIGTETTTGEYAWYGDLAPGAYAVRIAPSSAPECLLVISGQTVNW